MLDVDNQGGMEHMTIIMWITIHYKKKYIELPPILIFKDIAFMYLKLLI